MTPPGTARVISILARAAARRWLHRVSGALRFQRKPPPGAPRPATPRKAGTGLPVLIGLGFLFLLQSTLISLRLVDQLAREAALLPREDGLVPIGAGAYAQIRQVADYIAQAPAESREAARAALRTWLISHEREAAFGGTDDPTARVDHWVRTFDAGGAAAFAPVPETHFWPPPERAGVAVRAIGLLLLALGAAQILLGLGLGNSDLGKVEWSLEWLFTFPVRGAALFLARVCEYALVDPLGWLVGFPLLAVALGCSGLGAWGIAAGAAAALALGLIRASIRVAAETWLRRTFPLAHLRNIQALATVAGTLLLLGIFLVAFGASVPGPVVRFAAATPEAISWNPLSLPALVAAGGATAPIAAAALALAGILLPLGAARASEVLVRDGLVTASGVYAGVRGKAPAAAESRPGLFCGIPGKELLLLLRDRTFLVQTLVVPLVIVGFQLFLNPEILRGAAADSRHAAALAFGVGAYVLIFSGFQVLNVEGHALWLLYTVPVSIETIVARKATVWCGFASLYALAVLAAVAAFGPGIGAEFLLAAATALVGVGIYSFIAAALGVLATDPLQVERQRRIRPDILYLHALLSGMYALAIYNPSHWGRIVQIVLSGVVAVALWQKVRDRTPYLLDPTDAPPPRISLADGLIAAMAFFAVQGLLFLGLAAAGLPVAASLLVAYAFAAIMVGVASLIVFWHQGVPDLLGSIGIRSPGSHAAAVFWGLLGGAVAAGAGRLYLAAIHRIELLRPLRDELARQAAGTDTLTLVWLVPLAIVAAPVFEEYVFRGLVFRGLQRTAGTGLAILASAGLFAVVHPPVSALPVFVVGVVTAACCARTRGLLAPILAHTVYNGAMLLLR